MDVSKIVDPSVWAQTGGLFGLVIFFLFLALGIFIFAQMRIYEMHRGDMKLLLEMHAQERQDWGKIVDARQKETNDAINAMASAVNELNSRARRFSNGFGHE